jgi:serine/threonine-protein kinase
VYFEVVPLAVGAVPRPAITAPAATATATEQFTGVSAFAVAFTVGLIIAAFVARQNLLRGRGDRSAARRLSAIVFLGLLAAGFLSADHTRNVAAEWGVVLGIVGNALFNAGAMWLFYIAVEPYVRRRQPELLISWFRVIGGRFRDPLVGRDVLLGCLFGAIVHLFYGHLLVVAPAWLGQAPPLPNHAFPEKLAGSIWPLVSLGALVASVPLQSVATLFIVSAIKSVTRSNIVALAVMIVVGTLTNIGREMETEVPFVAIGVTVYVLVVWKAGLLAGAVALFSSSWLNASVFVLDPASWLFLPTLFYVAVFVALVWWGLRAAAGTRPLVAHMG